jgi:hypothetical protein
MAVRARWFAAEMLKQDTSKLSANELVLWRHNGRTALGLNNQGPIAITLPPPDAA